MQNTFNQLQSPLNLLNLMCSFPFWSSYSLEYFFPATLAEKVDFDDENSSLNKVVAQRSFADEYKSQCKINIILNARNSTNCKKVHHCENTNSGEQVPKVQRKTSQKETRNVSSNLMRIFLKNLIQLKVYTKKIALILARYGEKLTQADFYQWIQGFAINFKNYIRITQLIKIIDKSQPEQFRKTFLILLNHYSREMGLQHCLTSKRIERSSVRMHLQGLRSLNGDLGKQSMSKN